MIRLATPQEIQTHVKNDPVRPHISADWRSRQGREVYVLERDNNIAAMICVSYMDEVPTREQDMKWPGMDNAVFYTVWSYDRGAGREIVNGVAAHIKKTRPWIKRYVTLSPLTEMARKFHISNGAKFIAKHSDCQNFEYFL